MKPRVFHVYNDPGHGWVRVPVALLVELGISDAITRFSYRRGEWAYLEEDCDAGTFIEAAKAAGIEPVWVSHNANNDSKIRSYDRYFI